MKSSFSLVRFSFTVSLCIVLLYHLFYSRIHYQNKRSIQWTDISNDFFRCLKNIFIWFFSMKIISDSQAFKIRFVNKLSFSGEFQDTFARCEEWIVTAVETENLQRSFSYNFVATKPTPQINLRWLIKRPSSGFRMFLWMLVYFSILLTTNGANVTQTHRRRHAFAPTRQIQTRKKW